MENLCTATGIQRKIDSEGMHNPISVSPDGNYSIEFVECLASCGTAPVCMINDELRENVDVNSVFELIKEGRLPSRPQRHDGLEAVAPWQPHPLERRLVFKNIGRTDWKID